MPPKRSLESLPPLSDTPRPRKQQKKGAGLPLKVLSTPRSVLPKAKFPELTNFELAKLAHFQTAFDTPAASFPWIHEKDRTELIQVFKPVGLRDVSGMYQRQEMSVQVGSTYLERIEDLRTLERKCEAFFGFCTQKPPPHTPLPLGVKHSFPVIGIAYVVATNVFRFVQMTYKTQKDFDEVLGIYQSLGWPILASKISARSSSTTLGQSSSSPRIVFRSSSVASAPRDETPRTNSAMSGNLHRAIKRAFQPPQAGSEHGRSFTNDVPLPSLLRNDKTRPQATSSPFRPQRRFTTMDSASFEEQMPPSRDLSFLGSRGMNRAGENRIPLPPLFSQENATLPSAQREDSYISNNTFPTDYIQSSPPKRQVSDRRSIPATPAPAPNRQRFSQAESFMPGSQDSTYPGFGPQRFSQAEPFGRPASLDSVHPGIGERQYSQSDYFGRPASQGSIQPGFGQHRALSNVYDPSSVMNETTVSALERAASELGDPSAGSGSMPAPATKESMAVRLVQALNRLENAPYRPASAYGSTAIMTENMAERLEQAASRVESTAVLGRAAKDAVAEIQRAAKDAAAEIGRATREAAAELSRAAKDALAELGQARTDLKNTASGLGLGTTKLDDAAAGLGRAATRLEDAASTFGDGRPQEDVVNQEFSWAESLQDPTFLRLCEEAEKSLLRPSGGSRVARRTP